MVPPPGGVDPVTTQPVFENGNTGGVDDVGPQPPTAHASPAPTDPNPAARTYMLLNGTSGPGTFASPADAY